MMRTLKIDDNTEMVHGKYVLTWKNVRALLHSVLKAWTKALNAF